MTKPPRGWKLGTQAVHGGESESVRDTDAPVVFPLFQYTSYTLELGTSEGLRYPRYGNAPYSSFSARPIN